MEDNIVDLFADELVSNPEAEKGNTGKKSNDKASSLKSSMMNEAMGLMSNPKKLKGIIIAVVTFLIIGVFATIVFFVTYPICIAWAIGSYIVIAIGGRILKFFKHDNSKRDH